MKIIAITVLYKCEINTSKTLISLQKNYDYNPDNFKNFKLIVYDNGPTDQENILSLPFKFNYIINLNNPGLAVAYNSALEYGVKNSYDWILLLDQDSSIPENFIQKLLEDVTFISVNPKVKAVVPKMYYQNKFFSPSKVIYGGIHRPIYENFKGIYPSEIFAIGSGCLINIPFLERNEGFNKLFWLDCLDRWIFSLIFKEGGKVFVTDSVIEHDLSILNYKDFIDESRYKNIIKYETLFIKLYKSKGENIIYYFRLIYRIILFSIDRNKRKYCMATLRQLNLIFNIK